MQLSAHKLKTDELLATISSQKLKFLDNEVKLRSLYRAVVDIRNQNSLNGIICESIYLDYINKNEEAINLTKTLLTPNVSDSLKGSIYNNISNFYIHSGLVDECLDSLWNAYQVAKLPSYLDKYIRICEMFLNFDDSKLELIVGEPKTRLYSVKKEIEIMEAKELNTKLYKLIMKKAFEIHSTYCTGDLCQQLTYCENNTNIVLFHKDLDVNTVGFLNDKLEDALVELSFEFGYEEILKYPIFFTSENIIEE